MKLPKHITFSARKKIGEGTYYRAWYLNRGDEDTCLYPDSWTPAELRAIADDMERRPKKDLR